MTWRPLIESAERRAQLATVVRDIEAAVAARELVGNEHSDLALLRAYLGKDGLVDDELAVSSLSAAIGNIGAGGAGLFGGLAGTAWVTAHLAGGDEADEVCGAIERTLVRVLDRDPVNFDLVGGIAGFGILALERSNTLTGQLLATRVIDRLDRLAAPLSTGVAWHTGADELPDTHRREAPDGYWNLGVAHGAPGVIAMLARFVTAGVEADRAGRLCDGAVTAVLSLARARGGGDRFPLWHPEPVGTPSRVAWCYGDLGVACALIAAARARQRDDWRDVAIELARDCARRPLGEGRVLDAGLCHGAAGNAHLFNRLYQSTGDDEFRAAALAWFDEALALRRTDGVAGFASIGDTGWQPATDLLNGATGIGLAFHAAVSEVEPAWDRLLVADL